VKSDILNCVPTMSAQHRTTIIITELTHPMNSNTMTNTVIEETIMRESLMEEPPSYNDREHQEPPSEGNLSSDTLIQDTIYLLKTRLEIPNHTAVEKITGYYCGKDEANQKCVDMAVLFGDLDYFKITDSTGLITCVATKEIEHGRSVTAVGYFIVERIGTGP